MGDRGNIVMKYEGGAEIWFYTHWSGTEVAAVVQAALRREERWDDPAYLARIVFCELVKGREGEATGFGISLDMCDNEHLVVVVDLAKKEVSLRGENGSEGSAPIWTFETFCKLGEDTIKRIGAAGRNDPGLLHVEDQ